MLAGLKYECYFPLWPPNHFLRITFKKKTQTGVWHYPAHATSGSCLAKDNKLDSLTLRSECSFLSHSCLTFRLSLTLTKLSHYRCARFKSNLCAQMRPLITSLHSTPSRFITRSGWPWVDFDWPWIKTNQRVFCQSFAGFW